MEKKEFENLGKKLQKLAEEHSRQKLKPTTTQPTLKQLIAEGDLLLEEDKKKTTKESCSSIPVDKKPLTTNPYALAREKVLTKMDEWHRKEIHRMETDGNKDNRYYDDFVRKVRELGDTIAS